MKRARCISLFLFVALVSTFTLAQNAVPLVNQLRPESMAPGGSGFTLTVTGANFVSGATVNWNGSPRATTYVSWDKITAAITSADVAHAGTAVVTVTNPGPTAASNFLYFPIHQKFAAGAFARRDTALTSTGVPQEIPIVGDFNGDGKLDVAAMTGSTIEVFLGNGDGTFQSPISSNSSLTGGTLAAIGDFNGDGKLDLIAQDGYGDDFTYLGNGDGTFTEVSTMWGSWPGGVVVADLNRDGKLDVINEGAEEGAAGTDSQLGNGAGDFTVKWDSSTVYNQTTGYCAVADFNHDGKLDIACPGNPDLIGQGIEVAFGNGDGTFGMATSYPTPAVGFTVLTGDMNGDGKLDLVTDGGWVLLGNGDGTFNTPSGAATTGMFFPKLVDINADGKLDLVGSAYNLDAMYGVNSLVVALGNGDGTFQNPVAQEISWGNSVVGWGDFNGDGKLDAVAFTQDLITLKPIMSVMLQTNLAVSQTIISYGTYKVGTSSPTQVSVVTNIGASPIAISSVGFTFNAPDPSFTMANGCGATLAPGVSCTIGLTFTPQKKGALSAKLEIIYSGTVGNPQYIEMAGVGN
jgi:hypothetical protein